MKLARKYRVQAYPTLLFFSPTSQLIGRQVGYELIYLNSESRCLDPENHAPAMGTQMSWTRGSLVYVDAYGPNGGRTSPKAEDVASWLDTQEDLYTEVVYNVLMTMPDEKWRLIS